MQMTITHSFTRYDRGIPGYSVDVRITDTAGRMLASYGGPGPELDRWYPELEDLALSRHDDVYVTTSGHTTTTFYRGSMPLTALHPRVRTDIARAWIREHRLPAVPDYGRIQAQRASDETLRLMGVLVADGWSAVDAWYHARHCARAARDVVRESRFSPSTRRTWDAVAESLAGSAAAAHLLWRADGAAALDSVRDYPRLATMLTRAGCTREQHGTLSSAGYIAA